MIKTAHAVLAALTLSLIGASSQGSPQNPVHPNLVVRFTIVLPKANVHGFKQAVQGDSKFRDHACETKESDNYVFALSLYPSDVARQKHEYGDAVFECKIVNDNIYRLFNDKALEFANRNDVAPRYVRLLVDTDRGGSGNCLKKYCSADGLFHHAGSNPPCGYCP